MMVAKSNTHGRSLDRRRVFRQVSVRVHRRVEPQRSEGREGIASIAIQCRDAEPRPSGPPSATQRRASSVVIGGGREVCDHAARAPATSFRAGRDVLDRASRGSPVSQCVGSAALPGDRCCNLADPAPRATSFLRGLEGVRLRGYALTAGRRLKGRQDACPTIFPMRCCGAGFQPAHGTMSCIGRGAICCIVRP